MASLHLLTDPSNPQAGGVLISYPSGGRQAAQWAHSGPIADTLDMGKQIAAQLLEGALSAGRGDDAVLRMQEAVALERELPPPMGPPRPIKPASELFGEILLELGKPREAAVEFERALARWPNRSPALLGLARASAARGDRATASRFYKRLLVNYRNADPGLPEVQEAQEYIAGRAGGI